MYKKYKCSYCDFKYTWDNTEETNEQTRNHTEDNHTPRPFYCIVSYTEVNEPELEQPVKIENTPTN